MWLHGTNICVTSLLIFCAHLSLGWWYGYPARGHINCHPCSELEQG